MWLKKEGWEATFRTQVSTTWTEVRVWFSALEGGLFQKILTWQKVLEVHIYLSSLQPLPRRPSVWSTYLKGLYLCTLLSLRSYVCQSSGWADAWQCLTDILLSM